MGFFNNIRKSISNHLLPGLRQIDNTNSLYNEFMNGWSWSFNSANKHIGDLQVYYDAYNNVYVKSCIHAYIKYSLINGFSVTDKNNEFVDYATSNYLTHLFNDPQGKSNGDTFATLNNQIWKSWKLTGDCFIEINYDERFGNIPIGFKYVPTELIIWDNDTNQWGIRNTDKRYENDEIIHIYEPRIEVKNHLWGVSEIDSIGLSIALEFSGMKHNREIFENKGIDPKGIVSFDPSISNASISSNYKRLKEEKNNKGLLFLKGATYQSTGNNNKDMDFLKLMEYARDRTLVGFQVPPAIIGIIETAHLGSGTSEGQEKSFNKTLSGDCITIENAFNKALGRSGFKEVFEYNHMDLENKLTRAQIEDLQVKNGIKYINEIRTDYGLDTVPWGNTPMNYGMFGVSNDPDNTEDVIPIGTQQTIEPPQNNEVKLYQKALLLERLREEY